MKDMTMGLDMYAFKTKTPLQTQVDFEVEDTELFHYWRKHPDLHGWMETLYREKGGHAESFNVVNLQLTAADLDRLERVLTSKTLPCTVGFFFGASDGSELEDDLGFLVKARQALNEGFSVYYTSWW